MAIARYLEDMDRADREPTPVNEARSEHLMQKIQTIRSHLQELAQRREQLVRTPDG